MSQLADLSAVRLAAIVESSDDAIISKDLNGTILSWNRAAERMFGFTADEAVGKPITVIIPPDRLGEEVDVLARISRGELVEHYETLRRRKDGTLLPISLTVSPLRNADGVIVGASKIARDISERRRAEQQVAELVDRQRDLQSRLLALVRASNSLFASPRLDDILPMAVSISSHLLPADGYAVWRRDPATHRWSIVVSSGVSAEFTQRISATMDGKPIDAVPFNEPLIAESIEGRDIIADRLDAYRTEGIQSLLAIPLKIAGRNSGALVFYFRELHRFDEVEVQTAQALGNLASAAIMTADFYEEQREIRRQAERVSRRAAFLAEASAALAVSLDYDSTLQAVADLAVPDLADWCAVDILDETGEIRRVAVAHVDPEKVELARTLQEKYPAGPGTPNVVRSTIASGEPQLVPLVTDEMLRRFARSEEHLEALRGLGIASFICVPLVAHGRGIGALSFVTAESGRRYAEDDLRFAQDVAYRSAIAVDNARAYARANAANRAKDEFLAMLSHELRTPLNAVLGWVRMLRGGAVSEEKVPRALEVIEDNARAQLRLVEDLLDLSRIITGKFRLEVRPVQLRESIDAAVAAVQPAAMAKGIQLKVECQDVPPVHGDLERLQQAVWNLLSNAIKFTPGGGRVTVRLAAVPPHAVIEVIDTGEGISATVLPYVFDRFRQGDSGSTRAHSGLGLGLAIVRHIVELHGGRVGVESAGKGRGATFRIVLPLVGAGAMSQLDPSSASNDSGSTRPPFARTAQ